LTGEELLLLRNDYPSCSLQGNRSQCTSVNLLKCTVSAVSQQCDIDIFPNDPCFIVQFIKKTPTRCNNVSKVLLFPIYVKLNMFWVTHHPSSGAWNCTGSLWFFIRGRLSDV